MYGCACVVVVLCELMREGSEFSLADPEFLGGGGG